jgi:hypothetical protein
MTKWYYAKNGSRNGPVEPDEIKRLFQSGEIKPDDLVWEEGMPDWVRAGSVLQAAPPPLTTSAPAPQPISGQPTTAIPDYGDFLCWGIILCCVPYLGYLAIIVFVILHLIELNAVRTAVAQGRIQPSEYSNNHPVLVGFALLMTGCCCANLFHPFMMHWRNKSGTFKQQPNAVWFSIAVSIVCYGALIGFGFLQGFIPAYLEAVQEQAAAGR